MKLKLICAIIAICGATAALTACNEGQTGGGQPLNDGSQTRIVQEGEGGETHELPNLPEQPEDDGRIIPPPPPGGLRRPKRIFGGAFEWRFFERGERQNDDGRPGEQTPETPETPEQVKDNG